MWRPSIRSGSRNYLHYFKRSRTIGTRISERLFGNCATRRITMQSLAEARIDLLAYDLFAYFEWFYNRKRRHSTRNYLSRPNTKLDVLP